MDSKDLFNAIDIAAEEYADLRESIEGVRPVAVRADKKPFSLAKRIAAAAAACAAVVAIGAGVTVGVKNHSQRGFIVSGDAGAGSSERNFAPAADILRIRDFGFYTENMNDDYRFLLEENYKYPLPKGEKLQVKDSVMPPAVFYYNDVPLDRRMLSDEADKWLFSYCLLSEEDRAGETVPDEVKYLTGSGFVRFGDVGFLRDKYTEQELDHFKAYCANPLMYSCFPPKPDVYYYNDIPYHLDQILSEDTQNWLKWYCWLDEETQAQLGGYVPEEMEGRITACNSEKPPEIVTYKGRVFDVRSVSYDTEKYIKWYNSLSDNLKAKVRYAPEEISEENLINYSVASNAVELIGADGVPLTIKELYSNRTAIYKMENIGQGESKLTELPINELEQWDEILCYGFVYLAEPGSNDFKRYTVGDEIMGLKITRATTTFRRFEGVSDPALYYAGGEVTFEGTAKVDILEFMNDDFMKCEISGLPIIDVDEKARAEGKIVPKQHSADKFADDPAALFNDDSHCYGGGIVEYGVMEELQGQIQRDVEIEYINMDWRYDFDNTKWYQVMAHLSKND